MDVRERYGQLIVALGNKNILLGGRHFMDKSVDDTQKRAADAEDAVFEKLGQIREALNGVKCRVNAVCARHGTNRWHSFTSFTHPLKGLPVWMASRVHVGEEEHSSFLSLLYTQAFCKFVQLIDAHPESLLPFRQCQTHRSPRSLHLCELPGAFLLALMDERTIISIEKCSAVERWGQRMLDKIRPAKRPQMAMELSPMPPSRWCSWHQIWHPKNVDKICRLMEQQRQQNGKIFEFPPLVFEPNCEEIFAWLQQQHSNTTGAAADDGINDNGWSAGAGVVFGRFDDPGQRGGTLRVRHSLFAHPDWLKQAQNVRDLCAEGQSHDEDNDSNGKSISQRRRLSSKLEWLEFLIAQCELVSSANASILELKLGRSEAILQTFGHDGCAKFCFSQANTPDVCAALCRFLAKLFAAFKTRAAADHRWTLLKFVPLRFFDVPTTATTTTSTGAEDWEGHGNGGRRPLGEQIAEFNARSIALSSATLSSCAPSEPSPPPLLLPNGGFKNGRPPPPPSSSKDEMQPNASKRTKFADSETS
uniref:Mab-21 domain-containing protein n=1 Tax=Globodera pallida TaxID=36090 RepID=A0A183C0N5_GLOPA